MTRKLCINCLKENHLARRRRGARVCPVVVGNDTIHYSVHHQLPIKRSVHQLFLIPERLPQVIVNRTSAGPVQKVSVQLPSLGDRVSLRIVPVKVCGCDGGPEIKTYAFLDNRSDTTLCLDSLAQSLGVPPKPIQFSLTSINSEKSPRSGFEVAFNVQSLKGKDKVHLDKVWSVDCLPISKWDIPTEKDIDRWPHLCGIEVP